MIVTARLVVLGGGEGLLLLGRDGRVPLDELGEHAALGLQAERQRGDVEQEHALDVAGQDRPLDRRADGDDLVGVDALVRLLAEDLLDDLLDPRHPGRAADQHHLVDLGSPSAWRPRGPSGPGPRSGSNRLSVSCSNWLRVIVIVRCFGPVWSAVMNGRLMSAWVWNDRSFLAFSAASLSRCRAIWSLRRSIALLLLELVGDVVDQRLVPVVAAQVGVAVGREDLEDAVGHVEDRDVERAAAEVEDGDLLVLLLVEPVGQGRGGRLVDDPRDLQAGDLAGVLGRLPLAVVEVGRDGDDRLADLVARGGSRPPPSACGG